MTSTAPVLKRFAQRRLIRKGDDLAVGIIALEPGLMGAAAENADLLAGELRRIGGGEGAVAWRREMAKRTIERPCRLAFAERLRA